MLLSVPKAVIFDWDNTLIDTLPILHRALNATLLEFGLEAWSFEKMKQSTHHSLKDSFPLMFGQDALKARDYFYKAYRIEKNGKLFPLPGAEGLLKLFASNGLYMAVVSNKVGNELRNEAEHLGWTSYFSSLVGSLDCLQDKPSAVCVDAALSSHGDTSLSRQDVWFVGDSLADYSCAVNSGCKPILVDKVDAQKNAPYWSFDGCQELLAYCKNLIIK
jgi:phosphoglycolate phosphatase